MDQATALPFKPVTAPIVSATDRFALVYTNFSAQEKPEIVKRIKAKFPEILFPSVDFNIASGSELSELVNSYIYIRVTDKSRHLSLLSMLQKGLVHNEFKMVGQITGKEVLKFIQSYSEQTAKKFSPGDMIQVLSGPYKGVKMPVLTSEKDRVYCSVQILGFKKVFELGHADVEKAEVDPLPESPFQNFVHLSRKTNMRKALVIDGMYLMFRSVFGYPNLFAKNNTIYVGGAYGFYLTLLKLKTLYPEYEVFVVFDGHNSTKYENNPEYKANRQKYTDVFWQRFTFNIEWVTRLVKSCGFSFIKIEDQEGDDVLGSIAWSLCYEHGYAAANIYSLDTDFYSVVDEKISLLQPKKSSTGPGSTTHITIEQVRREFAIEDHRKVNWVRAAKGDTSDNIMSVNKFNKLNGLDHRLVQERFITESVNRASSLEELKAIFSQKPAFKQFLSTTPEAPQSQFDKNLTLLTINTSLMKGVDLPNAYHGEFVEAEVLGLLEEFSFYKEYDSFSRNGRVLKGEW